MGKSAFEEKHSVADSWNYATRSLFVYAVQPTGNMGVEKVGYLKNSKCGSYSLLARLRNLVIKQMLEIK